MSGRMRSEAEVSYKIELWKDKLNNVTNKWLREIIKSVISELKWVLGEE